eukprot:8876407-Pyramimonas_sp.AAC.1
MAVLAEIQARQVVSGCRAKEKVLSGDFKGHVFHLDRTSGAAPNTKDLERNFSVLQAVLKKWLGDLSEFFWADVFLMVDSVFADGKLFQREIGKAAEAVQTAKDLKACIACLKNLCRNSSKSKGQRSLNHGRGEEGSEEEDEEKEEDEEEDEDEEEEEEE